MEAATKSRDELIAEAMPLIPIAARKFRSLPRGINADDLESVGNEALLEAATMYQPGPVPWKQYAYGRLKGYMSNFIKSARRRPAVDLQPQDRDGNQFSPPIDVRSSDPADIAAAREMVQPQPRTRSSVRRIEGTLPSPAQVSAQAIALRTAMFDAITTADVTDVMKKVVESAKDGDLKAARLLIDLLSPARSGVQTVQQQAVIINAADIT